MSAFPLLILPSFLGPSASTPPLAVHTVLPPYDLGLHPAPGVIVVLLVTGYGLAAAGTWQGLRAIRAGWVPDPRKVILVAALLVGITVLAPPFGSADHLSYVAYGRIKALGADPYMVPPDAWPTQDPVISAVEAPWQDTTSVYGPIATAVFEGVAVVGDGTLRLTVWLWQLVVGLAFLLTGMVLYRLTRGDRRIQARVALLWLLNPALLAVLVGGAHLDAMAIAAAITGVALLILPRPDTNSWQALLPRIPWWSLAGVAFAVAAGTKLPYLAVAAAAWWAVHWRPARELAVMTTSTLAGAALVLFPVHAWAGPHVYDQTRQASHMVSLASPWRTIVSLLEATVGSNARDLLPALFAALALVVVLAARRIWRPGLSDDPETIRAQEVRSAARALLVLCLAYPIAAPYVLPWYDAPVWVAIVLADVPLLLEGLLVVRLAVMAISYVPGRADVPSSIPTELMLGVRHAAVPVLVCGLLGWLFTSALRTSPLRTITNASARTVNPRAAMAALPMKTGVPQSQDH